MSHHAYEFIVVSYVDGKQFRVVGRNGDEDIRLGDSFDVMYRYRRPEDPSNQNGELVRESERGLRVIVTGIEAMNRQLTHLGVGMTGALTIEGDGIGDIAPGWILGRRVDHAVHANGSPS